MPRREDERWAGSKQPRGIPLCPFCGSPDMYEDKQYQCWTCNKCEKRFPVPSYGSGKDFGKEARWLGKTNKEVLDSYQFGTPPFPPMDNPFDPDHPGYVKGEWERKHGGIFIKLIRLLIRFLRGA